MSVFELPTVTLIPNGIHHPPIEDGRLLPNSVKKNDPRLKHAFDLFLNGLSDKEVEEQTGINRRTFRRYRARYNVTVDQRKNKEKRDS